MTRTWTCRRVKAGVKCAHRNGGRKRTCQACGAPRPAKRRPKHMVALELSYEQYVELNGGNRCAICSREPTKTRRLDRDHCHKTGVARGLLCARCNRALPAWVTAEWLRQAAVYLQRSDYPADLPNVEQARRVRLESRTPLSEIFRDEAA